MIYEALKKNPNATIVLMTPFVLKVDLSDSDLSFSNDLYVDFELWEKAVNDKADIVRNLSDRYNTYLVDLNKRFKSIPKDFDLYSKDGIHPTVKGHKLIAEEWLKACKDMIKL